MLANFVDWLQRLFNPSEQHALICLGIGPQGHLLSSYASPDNKFKIVAFIDEESWNHRTVINGGRVHYPSELLALALKHKAAVVVGFEDETVTIDVTISDELDKHGIPLIRVLARTDALIMCRYIQGRMSLKD